MVVWLLAIGCGGSETKQEKTIGTTGGTVETVDGAGVTVPPGAVPSDTSFTVSSSPGAPAPANAMEMGTPYTFGPEGTQFSVPVTVKLPVDLSKLPAGRTINDVVVYTAPAGSSAYTRLPATAFDATHVVAQTTHFSTFVPALPTSCGVTCGVASGPCSPGGGCTMSYGCTCFSNCHADGTPASSCTGSPMSASSDGGTAPVCDPAAINYSFMCMSGTCMCQMGTTTSAGSFTCTQQSTPEQIYAAYKACGFPGELVTPAPIPDGGTGPSADGGVPMSGGCGSGAAPCTPCMINCPTGQMAVCTQGKVMVQNGTPVCTQQPSCTCR